jgi:protein TonB
MLLAALLALGIHAFILSMEVGWIKKKSHCRSKSSVITMTLASLPQPDLPQLKPVVKKPVIKKTKPLQPVKTTVKPEKKNPAKTPPVSAPSPKPKSSPESNQPNLMEKSDYAGTFSTEDALSKSVSRSIDTSESLSTAHVVREAIPLYQINPPPQYPASAISRGYQGTVLLEVLVDKNGKVSDLRVFKSSGYPVLDKKALAAVKDWLFKPGMKENKTVAMWVRIPIRFKLK